MGRRFYWALLAAPPVAVHIALMSIIPLLGTSTFAFAQGSPKSDAVCALFAGNWRVQYTELPNTPSRQISIWADGSINDLRYRDGIICVGRRMTASFPELGVGTMSCTLNNNNNRMSCRVAEVTSALVLTRLGPVGGQAPGNGRDLQPECRRLVQAIDDCLLRNLPTDARKVMYQARAKLMPLAIRKDEVSRRVCVADLQNWTSCLGSTASPGQQAEPIAQDAIEAKYKACVYSCASYPWDPKLGLESPDMQCMKRCEERYYPRNR